MSRFAGLGALIGALMLAACGGGSHHERAVSMGAVKAALLAADLRNFQVLPAPAADELEVYGEPLTSSDGVWMYVRVFPSVVAAKGSKLIAEERKDFPSEDKFDLRVCNVWLIPAGPSPLLPNERLTRKQAKAVQRFETALVHARDRVAHELRKTCT